MGERTGRRPWELRVVADDEPGRMAHDGERAAGDTMGTVLDRDVARPLGSFLVGAVYCGASLEYDVVGEVPPELGMCSTIEVLVLRGRFAVLPASIAGMRSLTSLQVTLNDDLCEVADEVCQLEALDTLFMFGNPRLSRLPENLGALHRLRQLDLFSCNLTVLPDSICDLSQLEHLSLNDNRLTHLPARIGYLPRLHTLWLSGNQLRTLPVSLGASTALANVSVSTNPWNEPFRTLRTPGHMMAYLRALHTGLGRRNAASTMLLTDASVA